MKEDLETLMNNCKNIIAPAGIEDMDLGKLRHQEGLSPLGMEIFFLVIVMLIETLDTNKLITNHMQEINIWGT